MLFHSLVATVLNYRTFKYYKGLMQIKNNVIVEDDPTNEIQLLSYSHYRSRHYLQQILFDYYVVDLYVMT